MSAILQMLLWLIGTARAGELACSRELGVAGGALYGRHTWEEASASTPWVATGSPELAMRCDAAAGPVFVVAGAETAPFYRELVGLRHAEPVYLTGTLGLGAGADVFRVAVFATGFVQTFGAGLSVEAMPFRLPHGLAHGAGFDVRLVGYPIGGPAVQAQVLFVVTTLRAGPAMHG